jgi:hypothetical protein
VQFLVQKENLEVISKSVDINFEVDFTLEVRPLDMQHTLKVSYSLQWS